MGVTNFDGRTAGTESPRLLAWTGVIAGLLPLPVSATLARQHEPAATPAGATA